MERVFVKRHGQLPSLLCDLFVSVRTESSPVTTNSAWKRRFGGRRLTRGVATREPSNRRRLGERSRAERYCNLAGNYKSDKYWIGPPV